MQWKRNSEFQANAEGDWLLHCHCISNGGHGTIFYLENSAPNP